MSKLPDLGDVATCRTRLTLQEIEEEIVNTKYRNSGLYIICQIKLANGEVWEGITSVASSSGVTDAHNKARRSALDTILGARLKAADALASAPPIAVDLVSPELEKVIKAWKESSARQPMQLIPGEKAATVRVVVAADGAITIDAPYVSMVGTAFVASIEPIPQV